LTLYLRDEGRLGSSKHPKEHTSELWILTARGLMGSLVEYTRW
jgi:hypothetical protein